jgi:membrane-associated phospholipid phosphatase
MRDYAATYQRLTAFLRRSPNAIFFLQLFNGSITRLMYLLYPLLLAYIFWYQKERILPYILLPGLAFLLVTLIRKVLNQARPSETWDIQPFLKKETQGQSMPSRHVFSATMISMCFLTFNLCLGAVLLILSATLAVCRVLGGVHYPKDVLVGMAIGILAGSLLFLF